MKRINSTSNTSRKVAKTGIFLAVALIVALIENMLPPIIPVLPYAKLGLSNIVLLLCLLNLGIAEGFIVAVLKCLLAALFAGNPVSVLWSLPAAIVSFGIMAIFNKLKIFSVTGMSAAGGMAHNFTQILVASIIIGQSVFAYLPYMLFAGGFAGVFTGILGQLLYSRYKKELPNDTLMTFVYERETFATEEIASEKH